MFQIDKSKQIQFISVYRFLAMITVLYYHLVIIPTYSTEVIAVISGTLDAPITPSNVLASIGTFIYNTFHVDTGSLAVVMFFIASGYLASKMMDRYTKKEYLVNRAVSLFPTLWTSIGVVALFVYFSQGITFTPLDILGSAFPFWPKSSGMFVSAVLWTLRVETKFYILAAVFGKNRGNLIFYGYILILLLSITYYEFRTPFIYGQMLDLQFMSFAFLGVLIERLHQKKVSNGLKYIAGCVSINILLFKISTWLFQDGGSRMTYPNVCTQIIPAALFLLLMKLEQNHPKLYQNIPRFVYSSGSVLLPLYLTHVPCGIIVMYHMSNAGCNIYLTLLGGIITSFAVAYIIYVLVMKPSINLMKKMIAKMRQREITPRAF